MSEIKYSICMPYYKRVEQLHSTLVSFTYHYATRKDYEIVLIEDVKSFLDIGEHQKLLGVLDVFKDKLDIVLEQGGAENEWNPARLYNQAARKARGDFFVITSPECFHQTNILNELDVIFKQNLEAYVVCACEAKKNCSKWIEQITDLAGSHYRWYQHSEFRNKQYHFCSALSRKNWEKVGGFDEDYAYGIAYEDDAFRDSIRAVGIECILRDDLQVIHIDHDKFPRPSNYRALIRKNALLYEKKKKLPSPNNEIGKTEVFPVTIACVLKFGGDYSAEYVLKLRNALHRNITTPFKFVCLTDYGEIDDCFLIPLKDDLSGWWSKLELFRLGLFDTEYVLYFDLDTIILSNIDDLLSLEYDFYALQPWNVKNRRKGRCASGMMGWKNNKYGFIYETFKNNGTTIGKSGDQAFISNCLKKQGVSFQSFQKEFKGIYSYKRNCREQSLPKDARIVCFHGKPRLHDVKEKWVQENWI